MTETAKPGFLNISSFQILVMFRRGLFYSYLSIYLRFFLGLSVTETTLFATLPMVVNVIFQAFVWGVVSDKFQLRRTLIIIGEVAAAIITFIVWYVHTLPESKLTAGYVIIIGLSVVEIFWSMSNLGWSALLSDLYPAKQRTGLQGKLQSIGAFGRFTGIIIGGLLYDGLSRYYEGWGFHEGVLFFIAVGVMLLSTIPMFYVPEGGVKPGKDDKNIQGLVPKLKGMGISKKYLVFLVAMTFIFFGFNSIVLIKSQYLTLDEGFNVSSRMLSYILSMMTLAIFIIGLMLTRLSAKFNDEKLLMVGAISTIIYLSGYALAGNLPVVFLSDFMGGVSMALIFSTSYSYASKLIPPEKRGKQFALYNATMFLSWGLPGTFLTGPLVDTLIASGYNQVFSYQMSFYLAALLVVVGAVLLGINFKMENPVDIE